MRKLLFMLSTVVFAAFATSCQKEVALDAEPTEVQTVGGGEKLQQNTKLAFETIEKFKTAPAANSAREALDYLFPILRKVPFNIDFSTMPEFIGVKTDISKLYGNYTYNGLFVYEMPSDNDSTISLYFNKDMLTTYQFEISIADGSTTELPFKFFNMDVKAEFDNDYFIRIRKDDVLLCDLSLQGSYSNQEHMLVNGGELFIYDEEDTTTPDEEKEPFMSVVFYNVFTAGTNISILGLIDSETDASVGCMISMPNSVTERASTESVNSWLFNYAKTLTNKIFSGELLSVPLFGQLMFNIDGSYIDGSSISFGIENVKTLIYEYRRYSSSPQQLAQVLNENITASCDDGDIYFALDSEDRLNGFVDVQDGEDIPLGVYIMTMILDTFLGNE